MHGLIPQGKTVTDLGHMTSAPLVSRRSAHTNPPIYSQVTQLKLTPSRQSLLPLNSSCSPLLPHPNNLLPLSFNSPAWRWASEHSWKRGSRWLGGAAQGWIGSTLCWTSLPWGVPDCNPAPPRDSEQKTKMPSRNTFQRLITSDLEPYSGFSPRQEWIPGSKHLRGVGDPHGPEGLYRPSALFSLGPAMGLQARGKPERNKHEWGVLENPEGRGTNHPHWEFS